MDNPEFLLALTDARLVTGDAVAVRAAARVVPRAADARARARRAAVADRRPARAVQRDAVPARAGREGRARAGCATSPRPARSPAVTDPFLLRRGAEDVPRLALAEDFLLRVRSLVHLERRRNDNVLGHELQEKLAGQFGYPGQSPRQRVEALMADYFRHARTVARVLDRARRTAPVPVGAEPRAHARTACGSSTRARRRSSRRPGSPPSRRRSTPTRRSPTRRWT